MSGGTTDDTTTGTTGDVQPVCGDGEVDADQGEECDDGNGVDGDACTNSCQKAVCGDGIVLEGDEECDDGNIQKGDGCSAWCHKEPLGIMLAGEQWIGYGGGFDGGDPAGSQCGERVSQGISGLLDLDPVDYPCKVQNACVKLGIVNGAVVKVNPLSGAALNTCFMNKDPWTRYCGEGQVAVGIGGKATILRIESFEVICAAVSPVEDQNSGFSVALGPPSSLSQAGTSLGQPFPPLLCPPGWVITDIAAKVDNVKAINVIKVLCRQPIPTF
ncbi:MAG: DUF4215 domain-containing protein [Nannocystis sp.]|nr:DUF4215 domain-containing protein [Nannocystis sp.]